MKKIVTKLPKIPSLLERKIYKTGQTRGADDDEIYQNRVGRNSTVLIPFGEWNRELATREFENGYIVLVPPQLIEGTDTLKKQGLAIGTNALFFYETRADWDAYNPLTRKLKPATSRTAPLKGHFVARVPATTAHEGGRKINFGFTDTSKKGAGIRFYEYASTRLIQYARIQLEALFWLCEDSVAAAQIGGMTSQDAVLRKEAVLAHCAELDLLDYKRLREMRILDSSNLTVCPLCLKRLSGKGFMTRIEQAHGREVPDLTVTEVSLFHIEELRPGVFNHRPYNLGWGHHHCNVVVKDSGIFPTLRWLADIVKRNRDAGVDL